MKKMLTVTFSIFLLVGCQSMVDETDEKKEIPVYKETNDINYVRDLPTMIEKTTNIVEGEFIREEKRDKETKFFTFKVNEVYKGFTEKYIKIGIPYQREITELKDEHGAPLTLFIPLSQFIQPELGKKTILFLSQKDKHTHTYSLEIHPYHIVFDQNDIATLKKPKHKSKRIVMASDNKTKYYIESEGYPEDNDLITGKSYSRIVKIIRKYN
ncbi:hypothetical protein [Thermoflavimicrobium daqui]|uniref:Lipoprotein n=1 Tax=Thermoflavimicrobium daqui TaxID=2137476 RepID=A0A364K5F8_9BACL|nr:hypothetical protein [Thermoflavimicrobium daqui]RAL24603.1 hypothetical protein DL897_09865 [Thermoflavimicrobium daqui]